MTFIQPKPRSSLTPPTPSLRPPIPKPFDMTEPFNERGVWNFWLTAEPRVMEYVMHLHCILQQPVARPFFGRRVAQNRMMFSINPRYDHQEAWLWIHELLDSETREIELSDVWENALEEQEDDETDNYNGPF